MCLQELCSENQELVECSCYLFDGKGKSVRPIMILLMAGACNFTQRRRQAKGQPSPVLGSGTRLATVWPSSRACERGQGEPPLHTVRTYSHFFACPSSSPAINNAQRTVAMAAEMIHTASLIHDDIIDDADIRRGRPTVNRVWGERKATAAGKFIVSQASCALARMGDSRVIDLLAIAAEDVVYGKSPYVNCLVFLTNYEKH